MMGLFYVWDMLHITALFESSREVVSRFAIVTVKGIDWLQSDTRYDVIHFDRCLAFRRYIRG